MFLDRVWIPPLAGALAASATLWAPQAAIAAGSTPAQMQAAYSAQAGTAANAARGQALFTTPGREWSCSSCHGAKPTTPGTHVVTRKTIAPLAPAFNPERFTDAAKAEKWFRRNCRDVLERECSAAEKADVLAWLRTLETL